MSDALTAADPRWAMPCDPCTPGENEQDSLPSCGGFENGTLAVAQWVLRALAVLSLLGAAAGVLGASGTRSLYDRHVPRQVRDRAQRLWPQSASLPSSSPAGVVQIPSRS